MKDRPKIVNGVPVPYGVGVVELQRMIDGNSPSKWAAFVALAYTLESTSLDLLARYLESKYAEVRRAALEAIGHHANGSKLEPLVLKRFDDRSPHVVRTACQSAASLGLFSAHDRILSLLNDSSPSTREVAVRALSSVWRPSDFDVVMKCFQKDHSNAVRKEASWTLGQHITKDNWKKLLCVRSTDSIPRHRSWACEIAGEFGSSNIREPLEKLLNDVDGHVRRAAKLALEKL